MNVLDKEKTWVKTKKCIDFGEIWVSPWVSYFCVFRVLWEEPFSLVAMISSNVTKAEVNEDNSHYDFVKSTFLNFVWQKPRWMKTLVVVVLWKNISQVVKEVEAIKKLEGSMQVLEMSKKVVKVQQFWNFHFGNMNIAREGLNLLAFGTMELIRVAREVQ